MTRAAFDSEAQALGADGLRSWMEARDVRGRFVMPGVPTPTVTAAAAALGVASDAILKSLVFLVDGRPWLVVAAGDDRISYRALARVFGVTRRKVRLADPEEALAISGYVVGAMPPFGHRSTLDTLVDDRVARPGRTVYAGGGSREALLELTTDELMRVTSARAAPLSDAVALTERGAP
ncbi:hypothetical protein BH23DEI1_BH23DEI1_17200 [soil metagenome]